MTIANTSRPAAGLTDEAANYSTQRVIEDYPGIVKAALRNRQTIVPLADRQYEATLVNKGSARVRAWGSKWVMKTDWAGGAYYGLSGSTASAPQTPYTRSELITWGEDFDELSISIKEQELAESALQLIVRSAQGIGESAADAADADSYTELVEEDLSAVPQNFVSSSRDTENQVIVAGAAGAKPAKGAATDYYDANGRRQATTEVEEMGLYYIFDELIVTLQTAMKMGPVTQNPQGVPTIIVPFGIARELQRQTKDFQADVLKTDYVDGRDRTIFLGRFNVLPSPHVKQVQANKDTGAIVQSGGVLHIPIHIVFPGALAYAERFQRVKDFNPDINQLGNDHIVRYQRQRLQWITDARKLYRVMLRGEA